MSLNESRYLYLMRLSMADLLQIGFEFDMPCRLCFIRDGWQKRFEANICANANFDRFNGKGKSKYFTGI